jgi:hypothetical protein
MMLDQHVFQLAGDFVRRYGDDGAAAEAGKALEAARLHDRDMVENWQRIIDVIGTLRRPPRDNQS